MSSKNIHAMPKPEMNEMEEAFVYLADCIYDECVALRVLADPTGETYPAIVDTDTNEVIALLCIPPRAYDQKAVH